MTIETIDAAIQAHRNWVARFRASLQGSNLEVFDPKLAADDTVCDLGRWLHSPRALDVLGNASRQQIKALHATFHDIAGNLATRLNQDHPGADIHDWISEFDNLSGQLVLLLEQARKKI